MALKVFWTPSALKSYKNVLDYLNQSWPEKVKNSFVNRTEIIIAMISSGKIKFRNSLKKDIYEVLVTRHNLLIYRLKKDKVILLNFFDTRQQPKKKRKIIGD